jgi:tetratricopeptide (TPR) repeat protein
MDKYPDAFARARAAAQRAQELGGMLAETQLALGKVALYSDWNVASAETYLRSALELNPSLSEARREYAWYLNLVERRNDALDELKRAQEIDPRSANISGDLGYQYWMAGQYDAAMREGLRTIELRPSTGYAYGFWVLGLAHAAKGSYDEAIAAHQQYSDRALLARTYALAGRTADARKLVAQLQQERPVSARRANGLAAVYAALGDKDAAFRWLESAYQLREPTMPWLRLLPEWIPLRGDPRFEDLARRIGVPPQGWGR